MNKPCKYCGKGAYIKYGNEWLCGEHYQKAVGKTFNDAVKTSYGYPTGTGHLAGSGYGKHDLVTANIDLLSKLMVIEFPKARFEKRANSDGLSGGVFTDTNYAPFGNRQIKFGISVRKIEPKTISTIFMKNFGKERYTYPEYVFSAVITIPKENIYRVNKEDIHFENPEGPYEIFLASHAFKRPGMAVNWIKRIIKQTYG